tara:strand:- start:36 stop:290 length:255 start_codon:yes stop_codon:yes gene_type:complete
VSAFAFVFVSVFMYSFSFCKPAGSEELQVECCEAHCSIEHYRVSIALHRSFEEISRQLRSTAQGGGTTALVSLFLGIWDVKVEN